MFSKWLVRALGTAFIIVTAAAVCQELEKPREDRRWHGKVGFIPYDFRPPTLERIKAIFWNAENERIFTGALWGVGWGINFYAVMDKLSLIGDLYLTEEDFLMPNESLRRILADRPVLLEGFTG